MAIVNDFYLASNDLGQLADYVENNWTFAGGRTDASKSADLWLDIEQKIGIHFSIGNYGSASAKLAVKFNGTIYHEINMGTTNGSYKVEITDTALIISGKGNVSAVSAAECEKLIICNGHNANNDSDEPIIIYVGSKSSSNVTAIYASDVVAPVDMSTQNSNANVNAKTTNLIPFYNTATAFITTDVYQSLCENISSWYFGDVFINGTGYRMSGSVFAVDE